MNILIADDVHELLIHGLVESGHTVWYEPYLDRAGIIKKLREADGLVIRTKTTVDREVLSQTTQLQFIARAGSGLDNIDTGYCEQRQIICFNAGEANADAVGEQTTGMLLALLANIVRADREVRQRIWDRQGNTGEELGGKTVGIIGYGNTGKAVARKLKGFGVRILAYDKYLSGFGSDGVNETDLSTIQKEADVITFHVPLTPETRYMANGAFWDAFQKSIYVLNLSRGPVINTRDLISRMEAGKIRGAALDVLEQEQLDRMNEEETSCFQYLSGSPRVILTPHIGGWSRQSYEKIAKVLLQKIKELTKT